MFNDSKLSSFQRQILTSSLSARSTLSILCKGLDCNPIINALVSIYSSPKLLLLKINSQTPEITSEISLAERQRKYSEGGVISVTSRILLLDLLVDRICVSLISGILVEDAHLVHENSIEAFILHLYRSKNNEGFIYAFSDCPEAFCNQFFRLEKAVKWLWTDEVQLWPRFHNALQQELSQIDLSVIELKVVPSRLMEKIQFSILEIAEALLKELKKTCRFLQEEITFDQILCRGLGFFPSGLGTKAEQLREDLRVVRSFLFALFAQDSLSFVERVREALNRCKEESSFLPLIQPQWNVFVSVLAEYAEACEVPPKFLLLNKLVEKDIPDSVMETDSSFKVLVVVNDKQTRNLVANYLAGIQEPKGNNFVKIKEFLPEAKTEQPLSGKANLMKRLKLESPKDFSSQKAVVATIPSSESTEFDDLFEFDAKDFEQFTLLTSSHVQVITLEDLQDIHLLNPNFIVLFDSNLAAIRRIEVYRNSQLGSSLKRVYLLIYSNSIQEKCHLEEVRSEKAAFERLITENSLIPRRRNIEDSEKDFEDEKDQNALQNLIQDDKEDSLGKIVVDTRDLRSALPFVLYRSGFKIIPATIEVGDYILSRNICIERKSVPDLISSLQSGRLYNQLQAMIALYKRSILLIEFDQDQFSFDLRNYASTFEIHSKIILLTIHFPQVSLIWSPTLEFTVKIFRWLKSEYPGEEPNVTEALAETFDERSGGSFFKEILKNVPGIDEKNVWSTMSKYDSLADFAKRATGKSGEFFDQSRKE